jgi:outer membrane lipase/esterase
MCGLFACNGYSLQAKQISHIIVFGDSLSDNNYADRFPRPKGRLATFSNGPTLADYFSEGFLGRPIRANNLHPLTNSKNPKTYTNCKLNGDDYAAGGATTLGPGLTPNQMLYSPPSTALQIKQYIKNHAIKGKISPRNLYILWAGSNDVLYAFWKNEHDLLHLVPAVLTVADTTADNIISQVQKLHRMGARHIIVINLPDFGVAPAFKSPVKCLIFTEIASQLNNRLAEGLAQKKLGFHVMQFDAFHLLEKLVHSYPKGLVINGKSYKFKNITTPACGNKAVMQDKKMAIECFALPGTSHYLFMDDVHPTTYAHKLIAMLLLNHVKADKKL